MVKHAVILAGGTGTRLWPASTTKHPKQFLRLSGGQSLFALTLRRAIGLGIGGLVCVVTHKDHAEGILRECAVVSKQERFPPGRIFVLAEPQGRNTAPAIAWACSALRREGKPEDTLIVMPADHVIEPLSRFASDVEKAAGLAGEGWLVTFGIPPGGPETGYGYIEAGEPSAPGFKVRKFKEKPDLATARSFLAQGNHYWNSGMFAFRTDRFLEELERHAPAVSRPLLDASAYETPRGSSAEDRVILLPATEAVEGAYRKVPSISIDYAVMERSDRCAVVPAGFSWSDVGSWDVVAEQFAAEPEEGAPGGGAAEVAVDATGNFVLSDLPVALAGVSDLIVVVKNGAVLVCRKGRSQLVKEVVQALKEKDREDLL
jgi:mannose-1-phosphate guanylyltransferase/mannose-6-phosphate isomerase